MSTLAVFIVLGGGAYAASGGFVGSNGAINGCVPKKGGTLQVLKPGKHCSKGLVPITFNAQGQPGTPGVPGAPGAPGAPGTSSSPGAKGEIGPKGETGARGETGEEGARGPSEAYEITSPGATNVTTTAKTLSKTVPAGSYVIVGTAQLSNHDASHVSALQCEIKAGATSLNQVFTDAPVYSGTNGFGDASNIIQTSYTTATSVTLAYSCIKYSGSESTETYILNPSLSAIQVAAIN